MTYRRGRRYTFLSPKRAAVAARVSVSTVCAWIARGDLPAVRLDAGSRHLVAVRSDHLAVAAAAARRRRQDQQSNRRTGA